MATNKRAKNRKTSASSREEAFESDPEIDKLITPFERMKADAEHDRWWADFQAKMPPVLKAALEAKPPPGSPFSIISDIHAAADNARAISPIANLLQTFDDAGTWAEPCLHGFIDTGNPLCAIGALADWPKGRPLDERLRRYLRDRMWPIYAMALQIAAGLEGAPLPSEAVKLVPELLGLGTRKGISNAFAEFRTWLESEHDAKDYRQRCEAGEKAEGIVADLAQTHGVSESTIWRRIEAARKRSGNHQRKPDLRSKRPRSK